MGFVNGQMRIGLALALVGVLGAAPRTAIADAPGDAIKPIAIDLPPAERQVDYAADILPLLQRNCLACHNATKAESDVVLETPALLRAARDGGALVIPGRPDESRMLQVAAHRDEPLMPPADNKVGAVALKPAELGLLQRWIEQGAKDSHVTGKTPIHWQAVPDEQRPIMATAVAAAGDVAVCARGYELFVYGLQPGKLQRQKLATLVDPALDAAQVGPRRAADSDMIRAVAMHADAGWIASAGFRTVKLWQRQHPSREVGPAVPQATVCAATADGKQLAIASEDGSIQLIDLSGQKPALTWKGHDKTVVGLAFARSGQVLVSVGGDVLRAWQTATGTPLAGWRLSASPKRLVMPADDLLITAGDDLLLRVWKLAIPAEPSKNAAAAEPPALAPKRTLSGHGRQITELAVLPGSPRQFLSGSVDGTVRLWNADDGSQLKSWIHGDAVSTIGVKPDGGRFVSVGADRVAKIWNLSEPNPVAAVQGDFRQARQVDHLSRMVQVAQSNLKDAQDAVQTAKKQLAIDQETKVKAAGALEATKKTLSEKTSALNEIKAKHDAGAKTLGELAQKRSQAEADLADAKTRSADSGKELELIAAAVKKIEAAAELAATTAALDKIRQELQAHFQSLERDAHAALDASTKARDEAQAVQDTLSKQVAEAQKALDAATAVSREADSALARADNSIGGSTKLVEAATRNAADCESILARQTKLQADASQQSQDGRPNFALAAFSPDGARLVLTDDRGRIFVYDAQTLLPLDAWDGAAAPLVTATFVDGADFIVVPREASGGGKVTRWQASPEWILTRKIGGVDDAETLVDRVLSLAFSPDGSLLAAGGGDPSRSGQISIWNISDGSLVRSIHQPHSDTVFGLAFSPDGQYLASASADRTAKVFRTADGQLIRTFEGHTDHVTGVTWRANGKQLATSSADHKIKIWNVELGEQQRTIDAGGKEVTGIAFAGIGGRLVSSSGDRNVRINNADDGAAIRTIAGAAGYLFCCATSETGNLVLAGGTDRVLRVWNTEDGTEVLRIEPAK
jgi:WD40 repeat protein